MPETTLPNRIQINHSLGDLVDAVNHMLESLENYDDSIGDLGRLQTADTSSVVSAINSFVSQYRNEIGDKSEFLPEGYSISDHLSDLKLFVGEFQDYDYMRGTNLVELLDHFIQLLERASGDKSDIAERLEAVDFTLDNLSKERMISVEDFGVVSSDTEDQTVQIAEAFNHAGAMGATVLYFPPGIFRFRPIIIRQNNLEIRGSGRRTILKHAQETTHALLSASGSVSEGNLNGTLNRGAVSIPMPNNDMNFVDVGTDVRMLSGIDLSLNRVPDEFTTGDETDNFKAYYYSEFNKVSGKNAADNTFQLSGGLLSNTFELATGARRHRVQKVDFHSGLKVNNIGFTGDLGGRFIDINYGKDIFISGVSIVIPDDTVTGEAAPITFSNSYLSEIHRTEINFTKQAAYSIGIRILSSEQCSITSSLIQSPYIGIEVSGTRDQSIARSNRITDTAVENSASFTILEEASHDTVIDRCTFNGFTDYGIKTTGRRTRVSHSLFNGLTTFSGSNRSVGDRGAVLVYGRGSQDIQVSNNTFNGVAVGVGEFGPPLESKAKNYSGLSISGNIFNNCYHGVDIRRRTESGGASPDGVNNNWFSTSIIGNTFNLKGKSQLALHMSNHANGVKMIGNTFHGHNVADRFVHIGGFASYITVSDNSASGFVNTATIFVDSRTDGPLCLLATIGNIGQVSFEPYQSRIFNIYPRENRSVTPSINDYWHVGGAALRWKKVWTAEGVDTPSDGRMKKNIKTDTLGLDFINQLNPVSYNWKDESKGDHLMHGFVAQEVEKLLHDKGIKNSSIVSHYVDESENMDQYSMMKDHLIAPLTKAIQELSAEVNELKKSQKESTD